MGRRDGAAFARLIDRQTELETANAELLEQERRKRERFYEYREEAARHKLEADQRVLDRLSRSFEPDDRRKAVRLVRDYERSPATAESRVYWAMTANMTRRLTRTATPTWRPAAAAPAA